jgi:hypothetical protein
MVSYILIIWLYGSTFTPTVLETRYDSLASCEAAGKLWEITQRLVADSIIINKPHHACLPYK